MELKITPALQKTPLFSPVSEVSKGAALTYSIDQQWKISQVRSKITSAFGARKKRTFDSLRIIGISHQGEELKEFLGENLEEFFKLDYDDYVTMLPTKKWKDYIDSKALDTLLDVVEKAPATFGEPSSLSSWKIPSAKDLNGSSDKK